MERHWRSDYAHGITQNARAEYEKPQYYDIAEETQLEFVLYMSLN
jgi:heat shock protein HspQ